MEGVPLQSELTEKAQGQAQVGKQPWGSVLLGYGWLVGAQRFLVEVWFEQLALEELMLQRTEQQ